jgi:hypothetical protein
MHFNIRESRPPDAISGKAGPRRHWTAFGERLVWSVSEGPGYGIRTFYGRTKVKT